MHLDVLVLSLTLKRAVEERDLIYRHWTFERNGTPCLTSQAIFIFHAVRRSAVEVRFILALQTHNENRQRHLTKGSKENVSHLLLFALYCNAWSEANINTALKWLEMSLLWSKILCTQGNTWSANLTLRNEYYKRVRMVHHILGFWRSKSWNSN
jgi:hypothetical protein